jgi:hypothetical protein
MCDILKSPIKQIFSNEKFDIINTCFNLMRFRNSEPRYIQFFRPMVQQPLVGQGLIVVEAS